MSRLAHSIPPPDRTGDSVARPNLPPAGALGDARRSFPTRCFRQGGSLSRGPSRTNGASNEKRCHIRAFPTGCGALELRNPRPGTSQPRVTDPAVSTSDSELRAHVERALGAHYELDC